MLETLIIGIVLLSSIYYNILFLYKIKNLNTDLQSATEETKSNTENLKEIITQKNFSIKHLESDLKSQQEQILNFDLKTQKTADATQDRILSLRKQITILESTHESNIKEAVADARADSIKRQRSILKGQATEQLAPYINPDYNPKDYKFMGDPIDFIIFDGMSDVNTSEDTIKKIIFMDIKTGKSQLNRTQRKIKQAIQDGRIEFKVYRPDKVIEELQNKKEL